MKLIKTTQTGIYYTKTKRGVTYYYNFKDPLTKVSKRIKLFNKETHLQKYLKECILKSEAIFESKQHININNNSSNVEENLTYQNYITLNQLQEKYYKYKHNQKKRLLKEQYNHLSNIHFVNSQQIKTKLANVKNEHLRYTKNVSKTKIANLPLNKILRTDVDFFINEDLGNSFLSSKSKFNIISLIKTIINFGIRLDIIDIKNPFEKIQFKNPMKQRERVLNQNELKLLLQKSKEYKNNINVYLGVYLGVLTAGRVNTILNIKKKDIDIENHTISLYNFKSSKQYKLQLNSESINWLKEKILPYYEPEEYLIRQLRKQYRQNPPQPLSELPKKIYEIMDELFNKGLNKQNNLDRDKVVNFHTIRRSIATNLVKNGTSVYNVMILLNHSSVEQTMKYLNTTNNDLDNDISKLMNNIFVDFKQNEN